MKFCLRRSTAILAVLALLAGIILLPSCGASGSAGQTGAVSTTSVTQADGVSSVTLNSRGTKLTVRAQLSPGFVDADPKAIIYLFELGAGDNPADLTGLEPVYSFRASEKSAWSAPLLNGSFTRLFCSYVLATSNSAGGYTAVGSAVPVLNPEILAGRTYAYPAAVSIKGIETSSVSDALSLGASHVVLDIDIEDYIVIPDPSDPATLSTLDYVYNGITYHFSSSALGALDGKVKTLTGESVIVYFRFLLGTEPGALPEKIQCLGYAGAKAASGYAVNIFNDDCAGYVAALFSLFAERYTRPSGEYGFCGSYIIGSDVNNSSLSNSAGDSTDADSYAAAYERLVRIARTALVSNYSGGRVYISLGSNWNLVITSSPADVSASAFLSNFSTITSSSGDYNWGVASSTSALDPADSSIWDDDLATGASSQFISPANISVLTYALSKSYTYAGSPRNTLICAFGVRGDTADSSTLAAQAASYALAYYKAAGDSAVGAFIYSTLDDAPGDTRLYGLRSAGVNGAPGGKKPVWDVFTSVDTKDDGPVGEVAALAGSEFGYLYGSLSAAVKIKSTITGEGRVASVSANYHRTPLFDFTSGGLSGFSLVSHAGVLDLSPNSGRPALHLSSLGQAGLVSTGVSGSTLKESGYLLVDIASSDTGGTLTLRLSQNGKNGYVSYESKADYTAGSQLISFDISGLSEIIESEGVNISLWFSPAEAGGLTNLLLTRIDAADDEATASPVLWIVVLSIIIFFVLLMLVALFTRFYHRLRRRRSARNRHGRSSGGALTTIDGE